MGLLKIISIGAATLTVLTSAANAASVTIAGNTFDDSAFADTATILNGSFNLFVGPNGGDFEDRVTGSSLFSGGACASNACSFEIGFNNNFVVNGAGDDLVVFGITDSLTESEAFSVTINGVTVDGFDAVAAGVVPGFNVEIASVGIDLSDFGLNFGDTINSAIFSVSTANGNTTEEFIAFAAANNQSLETPLPASFYLFAAGAFGIYGAGRTGRKKHNRLT